MCLVSVLKIRILYFPDMSLSCVTPKKAYMIISNAGHRTTATQSQRLLRTLDSCLWQRSPTVQCCPVPVGPERHNWEPPLNLQQVYCQCVSGTDGSAALTVAGARSADARDGLDGLPSLYSKLSGARALASSSCRRSVAPEIFALPSATLS